MGFHGDDARPEAEEYLGAVAGIRADVEGDIAGTDELSVKGRELLVGLGLSARLGEQVPTFAPSSHRATKEDGTGLTYEPASEVHGTHSGVPAG